MKKIIYIILSIFIISIFIKSDEYILITGGDGYIGSVTSFYFANKNHKIIILDQKEPKIKFLKSDNIKFVQGDYGDKNLLENIFNNYKIDAIIHFAGFIEVNKSTLDPLAFYNNNVANTIKLLDKALKYKISKFIFSSSAAVYGIPEFVPIKEDFIRNPINPYGNTKYIIELMLEDFCKSYDFQAIALRYFNAAGALPEYNLGELHENESHVIPILLNSIYQNKEFKIFDDKYNTKDGTCVRDYIHVLDLAEAHFLALEFLKNNKNIKFEAFNLGTGKGYTIKDLIEVTENVTNSKVNYKIDKNRPGDPDVLVCSINKANYLLKWIPKYSDIYKIISDANNFYKQNYLK